MSITWTTWCDQATNEQLGITQEEREIFNKKKHIFCGIGDKKIKDHVGETARIDKVFDSMPEEQKESYSKEVLDEGLKLIGIRKKKLKRIEDQEELTV